ncbi:SAM-dependent methyltransferase [Burkholderia sp. BDU5]|uniref:SAM-dependent methyltransferase n=1 Tax=Burkholderia sp. BDU5 TaxID=1385590 RepID=UPI000A5B0164|nr:SAM-dependent methyltransferase [Burkholderia sp. BDU5]
MSTTWSPPFPERYPDADEHRRRWRRLAREIAARAATITDDPAAITPPALPGSLEILGSGIEAIGFTRADEARIRAADHVFFCVADPATKVWLLRERPDAYDLYTLYDDSKRRYVTYMQMAEAMLHPVRHGLRVVAIFYGHPGIFVLATHRAVRIARREGHRAEMRAAVSALDTLCADLSVDPSQPGMQMYEATDMLIRARRPDTGLHLVLWQVGLIGELGYRRQGYLNSNFSVLLDYLEVLYGTDHPVVNYVGSRYPGVDPVIDRQTIASLRDPSARNWVTGISTFYLPPKEAAAADATMLDRLGLLQPGQPLRTGADVLRVIDRYGPRERKAFADFAGFDVPQSYQWQADTAAARFVLALCDDPLLRERYRDDPAGAVAGWADLSPRERDLLGRRDAGAIQLAAKGLRSSGEPENRRLLDLLLARKSASAALLAAIKRAPVGRVQEAAVAWSGARGIEADWPALAADFQQLLRRDLAVWTGFYLVAEQALSLSVLGQPGGGVTRVDLNGVRVQRARFDKGVLTWPAEGGNTCAGYLQPDLCSSGRRRWIGLIWPAGATPDTSHKLVAHEALPRPRIPASAMAGTYRWRAPDHSERLIAVLPTPAGMAVTLDDAHVDDPLTVGRDHFMLGERRVPFTSRIGGIASAAHLHGGFRLLVRHGVSTEVTSAIFDANGFSFGGQRVTATFDGDSMHWRDGPPALAGGTLTFVLDPVTLRPLAHGTACSAGGARVALRGMAAVSDEEAAALASTPRLGLPRWAWAHLVAIMLAASRKGGLFLWHGHERASTNLARVRHVLARMHRDGVQGA